MLGMHETLSKVVSKQDEIVMKYQS